MQKLEYAVHAYAWTSSWSNKTLDLIDRAKRLGFDLIEIPLMELDLVDAKAIRKRAADVGIGLCTSTACSEVNDPTGEDEADTLQRGLEHLHGCIRATAEMGATVCTGVTTPRSAAGSAACRARNTGNGPPAPFEKQRAMPPGWERPVGIEPINRYESFLVNTCDQALRLKEMTGEPNVAIHLDAYHMNIEEADFYEPTMKAAPFLCHYHLSESHRGTPGTGRVDWDGIYQALGEANYIGMVGVESFSNVSGAMAAATCIWRRLSESSDQLLSEGLQFLKSLEARYYGRQTEAAQVSPGPRHA